MDCKNILPLGQIKKGKEVEGDAKRMGGTREGNTGEETIRKVLSIVSF